MSIWRIQTNTSKGNIAKYCLENKVVAMGWSLNEHPYRHELDHISYDQYLEIANKYYDSFGSVKRLAESLRPNDLIWLRDEGVYYVARVKENSVWQFNNDSIAHDRDASNQVNNIDWIRVGDESDIPGGLSTAFIRGSTFERIYKPGILEYSELIFNQKSEDDYKYERTIELNKDNFFSLISPSDCEDLLYAWLYDISEKNYMCIPSTNKLATEKYEFVILDTATGRHIYIQVKNGDVDLNADDYASIVEHSDNEVYLLTTRGKIENRNKYKNVHPVDPEILFEFAIDETKSTIIPPNIKYWIEFAGGYNSPSQLKGIMFDTNDESSENYMFSHNVIAAWGKAKRYINSFNKDDIVLYYKKWYGIIAVAKILTSNPVPINDGLEHSVELLVPPKKRLQWQYCVNKTVRN